MSELIKVICDKPDCPEWNYCGAATPHLKSSECGCCPFDETQQCKPVSQAENHENE